MKGPKQARERDRETTASPSGGNGDQPPPPQRSPCAQLLHDLNQPLSAINNYAHAGSHLIDSGLADPQRMKELFKKISTQCERATELSQQMGKVLAHNEQQS